MHGARHPARALAFGTTCNGCCMEFHSRPRLLWHLMRSVSACLDAYVAFCSPCDDAMVDAAEVTDKMESRVLRKAGDYDRVALIPAFRVQGCALPPATRGSDAPGEVVPPSVPAGNDGLAQRLPVPFHRRLDVTVYYVLHFFSGQRRPGDFQDWLDQSLSAIHYPAWVISLDVAIGAKLCDLSCSGGVARWLDLAIAGRAVMALGAPPAKHGVLPSGMTVPVPRAMGPARSGLPRTCGACMILMQVSGNRSHSGMPSCGLSFYFLLRRASTALLR